MTFNINPRMHNWLNKLINKDNFIDYELIKQENLYSLFYKGSLLSTMEVNVQGNIVNFIEKVNLSDKA